MSKPTYAYMIAKSIDDGEMKLTQIYQSIELKFGHLLTSKYWKVNIKIMFKGCVRQTLTIDDAFKKTSSKKYIYRCDSYYFDDSKKKLKKRNMIFKSLKISNIYKLLCYLIISVLLFD